MSILSEKASRDQWIHYSDSIKTQKGRKTVLNLFDVWLKTKDTSEEQFFQEMIGTDESTKARTIKTIQDSWLEDGKGNRTVAHYRGILLQWFLENDLVIQQNKLKNLAKLPKIHTDLRYTPDKEDIRKIIMDQKDHDVATFYLCLVNTGMRDGELISTKISEIDFAGRSIRLASARTKTRTERLVFFTDECRVYLRKQTRKRNPDELIFKYHINNYEYHLRRTCKKIGLDETYPNGFHKMVMHRFRAYTKQALSSVSNAYGDVILGHIGGLSSYDISHPRKMLEDYDTCREKLIFINT